MKDLDPDVRPTYATLIASMEVERLVEVSDDDYQGDTRLLLRQNGRYGYLCFGWGSCSGCDALEDATPWDSPYVNDEVIHLRDNLWNQIVWHETATDMLSYFRTKDWNLDYRHDKKFSQQVENRLEAIIYEQSKGK